MPVTHWEVRRENSAESGTSCSRSELRAVRNGRLEVIAAARFGDADQRTSDQSQAVTQSFKISFQFYMNPDLGKDRRRIASSRRSRAPTCAPAHLYTSLTADRCKLSGGVLYSS